MSLFNRNSKEDEQVSEKTEKNAKKKAPVEKQIRLAHRVLLRPVITEKATLSGTYIFEVHPSTNKSEVKKAIHEVYGVTPAHVRVINVSGKQVRWNSRSGKRSDWKKAIVRLPKGQTINVYEGT